MALAVRMVRRGYHAGRKWLAQRPRPCRLVVDAVLARVRRRGNPADQLDSGVLVGPETGLVVGPGEFGLRDRLSLGRVADHGGKRGDKLVLSAALGENRRYAIREGAGDLVKPLGLKPGDRVALEELRQGGEAQAVRLGGGKPQLESLRPYAGQKGRQGAFDLLLAAVPLEPLQGRRLLLRPVMGRQPRFRESERRDSRREGGYDLAREYSDRRERGTFGSGSLPEALSSKFAVS